MYYQEDKRIGPLVLVDDVNVYDKYNADLIDYTPVAGRISTDYMYAPGRSKMNLLSFDFGQTGMTFSYYVGGEDEYDAARNVSGFIKASEACVIQVEDDPLEYVCLMSSYTDTKTEVDAYHLVSITYAVIKRSHLKQVEGIVTQSGGTVAACRNIGGTEQTGVRITLVPNTTDNLTISLSENGVLQQTLHITNAEANAVYVIDGIDGVVTKNGVNCFADINLYEFPKTMPGQYYVTVHSTLASLIVEYYEIYT